MRSQRLTYPADQAGPHRCATSYARYDDLITALPALAGRD